MALPQCPACDGRLEGQVPKCKHCSSELMWVEGIPHEVGKDKKLLTRLRQKAAEEAEQTRQRAIEVEEARKAEEERIRQLEEARRADPEKWYARVDGNDIGPFSWGDIQRFAEVGKIAAHTRIKEQESGCWKRAWAMEGLFPNDARHTSEISAEHWFAKINREYAGPYSWEELRSLAKEGSIAPLTRIKEGRGGPSWWAGEIEGLFSGRATE